MNSTARRGELAQPWQAGRTSKAAVCPRGSRRLVLGREAGWGDAITEAYRAWLRSRGSPVVPVAAWPEGASCDPVKMVFTDPS